MKRIITGMLTLVSTIMLGQPTIDGTFDGAGTWGSPVASDGDGGWAGVDLDNLYVTFDDQYVYLGATFTTLASWQQWGFVINTSSGGGSAEAYGYPITHGHTDLPDYILRGRLDGGGAGLELVSWNGSAYSYSTQSTSNWDADPSSSMIEVRVLRSDLGNPLEIDVQFYVTGDNSTEHGTFDAIPDDQNAASWNVSSSPTVLDNYASDLPTMPTSTAAGDWSTSGTWVGGSIPPSDYPVNIAHDVTLDTNATVSSITISSGTFTASDASARTLTISRDANGSTTTITNSGGTWANGSGGSTVVFSGNPSSGDAIHQTSGTLAFQNVTIEKDSGATRNVGVDFQTKSSVSGTLKIGNGGYVSTAPPDSFYGGSAILEFDQGPGADYVVGASDNSWSTREVPQNITVTSGKVTLNGDRTATGDLIVSSNGELDLSPGADLQIDNDFTLDGTITLNADGTGYSQLKVSGTLTDNGTFNHEQNFTGGWQMVAASMNATSASYFGANVGSSGPGHTANTDNLFWWNGTQYQEVTDATQSIVPGRGYFGFIGTNGFQASSGVISFEGTPNTSVTPSLTFLTATAPLSAGTADGWNLIANPFTCALDFSTISLTNVNDAFYIYDPSGSYVSVSPAGTSGTDIAPMQSFWVQANAGSPSLGTLTMAANGTVSSVPTFYKNKKNFDRLVLKTFSSQDSTAVDQTIVSFVGAGTNKDYDGAWDAHKLLNAGNFPNIYSKYNGSEISINGIDFGPNHPNADSIDIAFQAPNAGEVYEISIDKSYMLYPYDIMLEDKKLGIFTDLNQATYQFPYDDNFVDRFVLHFSSKTVGLDHLANRNANSLQVWMHNGAVNYLANYEGAAQMDLLDLSGKKLWSAEVNFEKDQQASLTLNRQLPAGIYLLRSQEGNGKVQTEKVYLK